MIVVMRKTRQVGIESDHLRCETECNRSHAGKIRCHVFVIVWSVRAVRLGIRFRSVRSRTAPTLSRSRTDPAKSTFCTVRAGEWVAAGRELALRSARSPGKHMNAATVRRRKSCECPKSRRMRGDLESPPRPATGIWLKGSALTESPRRHGSSLAARRSARWTRLRLRRNRSSGDVRVCGLTRVVEGANAIADVLTFL